MCTCGQIVKTEQLIDHISSCAQMLQKYSGLVQTFVQLKKDANPQTQADQTRPHQMLQNLLTLLKSFAADIEARIPKNIQIAHAPQ